MAQHIAVLRGWHPALAMAELTALLPNHYPMASESNRLAILEGSLNPNEAFETLSASSGCQAILLNGFIHNWQDDQSILLGKIETYLQMNKREGKMAVVPLRIEGKISQFSSSKIVGKIGAIMSDMGFQIDLSNPQHRFSITIDGVSSQIACGWMVGGDAGSDGVATRKATQRPFFKPVSLSPRLALLAVNLATGPIGQGPVIDPMTGTGGFIMEAAATNRQALGIDLSSEMVEGANQNLNWLLEQQNITDSSAQIVRGDATNIEASIDKSWVGKVKGFVFDPPYGRNSQGSLNHDELLTKTLSSAHQVASSDANLVLIVPINSMPAQINSPLTDNSQVELLHGSWNSLQQLMKLSGWVIKNRWVEHVHGSLSRLVIHSEYVPLD